MKAVGLIATVLACLSSAGSAETISYKYDAKGRLIKVVKVNTTYTQVVSNVTYDRADNRTRVNTVVSPR